jgi:hypothetical protein
MAAFRAAAAGGAPNDQEDDVTPEEHKWLKFVHDRVAGILPQRYYVPDKGQAIREVGPNTPGAKPAHVLDTLDGNYIVRQISPLAGDEQNIIAAVQKLQKAIEEEDELLTPQQVEQLAVALAAKIPRELLDEFDQKLREATNR